MGLIGSSDRLFKRPHPLRERCYAYVDGDVSADRIFTVRRAERLSVRSRVRSRASSASLGLLFRSATNSSRPLRVPGYQSKLVALLMLAVLMLLTACGSQTVGGRQRCGKPEAKEETSGEVALTPPEATVCPNESGAMPAEGREKNPSAA
jgi:hypothetical protein